MIGFVKLTRWHSEGWTRGVIVTDSWGGPWFVEIDDSVVFRVIDRCSVDVDGPSGMRHGRCLTARSRAVTNGRGRCRPAARVTAAAASEASSSSSTRWRPRLHADSHGVNLGKLTLPRRDRAGAHRDRPGLSRPDNVIKKSII
jgi:hypothetical protein